MCVVSMLTEVCSSVQWPKGMCLRFPEDVVIQLPQFIYSCRTIPKIYTERGVQKGAFI